MPYEEKLLPFHAADLAGARVLVLAPHPDDEALGCGGSLALHVRHGDPVRVAFVTSGDRGDWKAGGQGSPIAAIREAEAGRALACLGIDDWQLWRHIDRGLLADAELAGQIAAAIDAFEATLVYLPSPLEIHPDHRALAEALQTAVRGRGGDLRIAWMEVGFPLPPNALIDVSEVWAIKEAAICCYESQLAGHDYLGRMQGLARYRGLTLGERVAYAEAFRVTPADALDDDPIWHWRDVQDAAPPTLPREVPSDGTVSRRERTALEQRLRRTEEHALSLSREAEAQQNEARRLARRVEDLEIERRAAASETTRLNREVARRQELIEAMRATRLWRLRERLRGS